MVVERKFSTPKFNVTISILQDPPIEVYYY
jgi:hypothetical protein